jgi:hypothetical protein
MPSFSAMESSDVTVELSESRMRKREKTDDRDDEMARTLRGIDLECNRLSRRGRMIPSSYMTTSR